jgi:hypothetical protein
LCDKIFNFGHFKRKEIKRSQLNFNEMNNIFLFVLFSLLHSLKILEGEVLKREEKEQFIFRQDAPSHESLLKISTSLATRLYHFYSFFHHSNTHTHMRRRNSNHPQAIKFEKIGKSDFICA